MRVHLHVITTALLATGVLSIAATSVLAQGNPLRNAYFGETHVHTSWSLDAWTFGDRETGPGDAYKYFKGETIKAPLGYDVRIDTPLDFAGVTDHSEYVGVVKEANDPSSPISKLPAAQPLILKNNSPEEAQRVFLYVVTHLMGGAPNKALMSSEVAHTVWDKNVQLANKANEPGKFTAFCSYEWTSVPNNMNLHRNVFFKSCAHVPAMPFTALDSHDPSDLWKWMDDQRKVGNELLAISHNANLSDGRMYPTEVDLHGRPIDKAYAEDRMRNEPLIEIKQTKGQSETHPLLSPMTNSLTFRFGLFSSAIRLAVFRISSAATPARLSRTDSHWKTPRASIRTSSASAPLQTRTPLASPIARITTSEPLALWTEASRGACRGSSPLASICAGRGSGGY